MKSLGHVCSGASLVGALALLAAGCGTNPSSTSVVCTEFRAGADLSSSTFGVTGDLQRPYIAFAQAAGDISAVADELLRDVGASCHELAVALGADPREPRTLGKLEPEAVGAWCTIAAERFTSVRAKLTSHHFGVQIDTPKCNVDTAFQTACEARCQTAPGCAEPTPEERCPADARQGVCPGTCTGTCNGSETAAATCAGACNGTCFGTCSKGDDEKADCSTGCVCASVCKGTCTASCDLPKGGRCDAPCAGTCSEPMLAPTCNQPLADPVCAGDVDCQKSCRASALARAICPAGSLAIVIDKAARSDPALAQIVGALERALPPIFLASRGRAKALNDGASGLLESAGHLLDRADQIGPMGAACGILIGETGAQAQTNLVAANNGAVALANAINAATGTPSDGTPSTPGKSPTPGSTQ
jgi:hypothetical protein